MYHDAYESYRKIIFLFAIAAIILSDLGIVLAFTSNVGWSETEILLLDISRVCFCIWFALETMGMIVMEAEWRFLSWRTNRHSKISAR